MTATVAALVPCDRHHHALIAADDGLYAATVFTGTGTASSLLVCECGCLCAIPGADFTRDLCAHLAPLAALRTETP